MQRTIALRPEQVDTERYARCVATSKRVAWDIDTDIIRGRAFGGREKYLPDGLTLIDDLDFLTDDEKRFVSQIQGRTYANFFSLVERFINAKVLELSRAHRLGDQIARESLIRFSSEEMKHQELFRRIEALADEAMPTGYHFVPDADNVTQTVLGKSTWAVLALTLDIELFTQLHYRESIDPDETLSPLFKDVFLYHWIEESQHAVIDEMEWTRHDATLTPDARDIGVKDFIELIEMFDRILQAQAREDMSYFAINCAYPVGGETLRAIEAGFLKAYRWQFIHSGTQNPRFAGVLGSLVTEGQAALVQRILASFA